MRHTLRFTLIYLCSMAAYVALSCQILPVLFPQAFPALAPFFGWAFVLLSTMVWFVMLRAVFLKQSERLARLQDDAVHDPLTRLINRRAFIDNLEAAIHRSSRNGTRLGLAFIDLDGFKQVNDVYGHTAGDQLLVSVAQRLEETIRKGDIIARMGGDEFVVLVEPDRNEGCEVLAKRLLEAFQRPFMIEGHTLDVKLSIGVAFSPEHARGAELLIRAADMAMYRVKKSGRNGYALAETGDAAIQEPTVDVT